MDNSFSKDFGGKRKVLVVDDEYINRQLLGMILSEEYEVLYAENGREALNMIRSNHDALSVVMLDLIMPQMDGFELLELIRGDDDLRRIPIIVLTSEKEAEVRSLKLGAADFIKKPYDMPEVILARVQRTIDSGSGKGRTDGPLLRKLFLRVRPEAGTLPPRMGDGHGGHQYRPVPSGQ